MYLPQAFEILESSAFVADDSIWSTIHTASKPQLRTGELKGPAAPCGAGSNNTASRQGPRRPRPAPHYSSKGSRADPQVGATFEQEPRSSGEFMVKEAGPMSSQEVNPQVRIRPSD